MGQILIFLLFFSGNSFAATVLFDEVCTAKSDYTYCIYKAKQGNNKNIAYYFHGRGGRPESWGQDKDFSLAIQHYWLKNKIKPPVVISVSFGKEWLLAPKLSSPQSGLYEKFKISVIPEVESKLFKPEKRIVFGKSMGGLNALIAGLTADGFF